MTRTLMFGLVVLLVGASGCQDSLLTDGSSAPPVSTADLQAPSHASAVACSAADILLSGPSNIVPGGTGTYTVSARTSSTCTINNVTWTLKGGPGFTSSPNALSITVAPSGPFNLEARVVYDTDNIVEPAIDVTYGPVAFSVSISGTSPVPGILLGWTNPSSGATNGVAIATNEVYRSVRTRGTTQTVTTWLTSPETPPLQSFTDGQYYLNATGGYNCNYTVEAVSAAGHVIGRGSAGGRCDTSI